MTAITPCRSSLLLILALSFGVAVYLAAAPLPDRRRRAAAGERLRPDTARAGGGPPRRGSPGSCGAGSIPATATGLALTLALADRDPRRADRSARSPTSCARRGVLVGLDTSVGVGPPTTRLTWSTQLAPARHRSRRARRSRSSSSLVVAIVETDSRAEPVGAPVPDHRRDRRGRARQHRSSSSSTGSARRSIRSRRRSARRSRAGTPPPPRRSTPRWRSCSRDGRSPRVRALLAAGGRRASPSRSPAAA